MGVDAHKPAVLLLLGLAACSPALNWREVRPDASGLVALFPCKPRPMSRTVALAGGKALIRLLSCDADGATFAIAYAGMPEPAKVGPALEQLRDAAANNIGGRPGMPSPLHVGSMTPHPLAQRWTVQGHGPDGKDVVEQVGFFTKGLVVYQATVVGPRLDSQAADTFFDALKFP